MHRFKDHIIGSVLFLLLQIFPLTAETVLIREIMMDYHGTPLRTVLQDLSEKTDLKFVYYDELVDGKQVSCRFASRSLTYILNRVILPQGLLYQKTSGKTVTLYWRDVPPHSWVLQGQVLSGDSGAVRHAFIRIGALPLETSTDSLGCFLFMDLFKSPCRLTVLHADFIPFQTEVDSSQNFYTFILKRKPVHGIQIQKSSGCIRSAEASPESCGSRRITEADVIRPHEAWESAPMMIRLREADIGLRPFALQSGDLYSYAPVTVQYEGIPILQSDGTSGFHRLNTGRIRDNFKSMPGRPVSEVTRLYAPDFIRGKTGMCLMLDPWTWKASAFMTLAGRVQMIFTGRQTHPFQLMRDYNRNMEDYSQLLQFQTLRPASSPMVQGDDFSAKVAWNFSKCDRLETVSFLNRHSLDASVEYTDTSGQAETQRQKTSRLGLKVQWQHTWTENHRTQLSYIHSGIYEQYHYANPRIFSTDFYDKDDVRIQQVRISHEHESPDSAQLYLGFNYCRYSVRQAFETGSEPDQSVLGASAVPRLQVRYSRPLLVLLHGQAGISILRAPAQKKWLVDPSVHIRYRLTEHLVLHGGWNRNHRFLHRIPNRIRTLLPKRTQAFWAVADSSMRPLEMNDYSLSMDGRRKDFRLYLSVFYQRQSRMTHVLPYSIDEADDSRFHAFLQGNAASTGIMAGSELNMRCIHVWSAYRWSRCRMQVSDLNSGRKFTPDWHRAHDWQWMIRGKWHGFQAICSGRWASGATYIHTEPAYRVGRSGPDTRLDVPADLWDFKVSPPYFRLDFSVEKWIRVPSVSDVLLGLSVINILNRNNMIGSYYYVEPDKPSAALPQPYSHLPELPRTFYGYLRIDIFR